MLRICFNLGYQPKEWEVFRILVKKSLQYGEAAFALSSLYSWFLKILRIVWFSQVISKCAQEIKMKKHYEKTMMQDNLDDCATLIAWIELRVQIYSFRMVCVWFCLDLDKA